MITQRQHWAPLVSGGEVTATYSLHCWVSRRLLRQRPDDRILDLKKKGRSSLFTGSVET
jgi:hypothetical protein